MGFFELFFGDAGGVSKGQLERDIRRCKFSDYLPYLAYDPDGRIFVNADDTLGLIWDCAPVVFSGERTVKTLDGLLRIDFPEGAIMQFILHGDPYVEPILARFREGKEVRGGLFREIAGALSEHFRAGADGRWGSAAPVLRNFRLLFCVKWPREARVSIPDVASMVAETLTGAGLAPEAIGPRDLLAWLRRLLNDNPGGDLTRYDEGLPIRRQAIFAETITTKTLDHVRIGRKEWRCLTPKAYPAAVDPLQTNQLFGGIDGSGLDSDQIPGPFLYCLTVLLEDQKTRLHTKTNMTLIQQGAGSFAPALARRKEEYLWAAGEIERGVKFYKIIPTLWVYDEPGKARKSLDRARRLWESQGYLMQEDRGILPILLIAALPFGLYDIGRNVDHIDRD
jgi:conjugal transfer ATP-binding protein TraC